MSHFKNEKALDVLRQSNRSPVSQRERIGTKREKAKEQKRQEKKETAPKEEFFLGRDPRSPFDILRQKGRTTPERKGFLGEPAEEAKAIFGFLGEALSEGADIITGRTADTEREFFDTKIPGTERLGRFAEAIDSTKLIDSVVFASTEDGEPSELSADFSPEEGRQVAANKIQAMTKQKEELQRVDSFLSERESDPAQAFAAQEMREEIAVELARLEVDLLELYDKLGVQNVIFDVQAENAGLSDVLDLAPLEQALKNEGGLGHQTYQAITDLANNAALTVSERDEAIDIVLARQSFSEELINKVNDMVDTKVDLETLQNRPDAELLGDAANFLNPDQVNFNVTGATDAERFFADMLNTADLSLDSIVPDTIPPGHESEDIYLETVLLTMEFGVDHSDVQERIAVLSQMWDIDESSLVQVFQVARDTAMTNKDAWDDALDATSAVPNSGGMVAAIHQAGEEMGFDPDQLEMAAKSADLHALIDVKSGGISGTQKSGTIAGVGGLTLEMYEGLMPKPWTPTSGLAYELTALLRYIDEFFQGDALKAVQFYHDSGEWGGTESFEDG